MGHESRRSVEDAGGFEPLHDPLSSPGWLMLILGAIVEPLVLTMLEFHAHVLRAAP